MNTFMDKFIDWKEFEIFVKKLYESEDNLVVEHDVTLTGKSGAKRQIDVMITQKSKLHEYITIVECKRWKERVSRNIIDILYASVEDLNASKGVVFTTTGYEDGAEKYAKSKNIDIFVIRDLTEEEWGLPGRHIQFYMQSYAMKAENIRFKDAKLTPIVDEYPDQLKLKNIEIAKDMVIDDSFDLYSKIDGHKGPNFVNVFLKNLSMVVNELSKSVTLLDDGRPDACMIINSQVELNFKDTEYKQLRYPFGVVNIDRIIFELETYVTQTVFSFDRAEKLDYALIVENYINRKRHIVSKKTEEDAQTITDNIFNKLVEEKIIRDKEVLQNGSILKVFLEPYVNYTVKGNEINGITELLKYSIIL